MSNDKLSGDSSRRNFLSAAAVAGAAVTAPTVVQAQGATNNKKNRGIYRDKSSGTWVDKIADFSYTNDALAQLIVDMWLGKHKDLITPEGSGYTARSAAAKTALAERGIILQMPIVITEKEYVDGFRLADAGLLDGDGENIGVVFVLPRQDRAINPVSPTPSDPPPLLETARMLMAITPNGI
jgi:hypothetical protein